MNDVSNPPIAGLHPLAKFRFELRKFLAFSEATAERYGIATQQYQLMQVIAALPEGSQSSITYLAERMVLRHNSTVELVDRAERSGLVTRETDPTDLRRSLVRLTPEGFSLLERMVADHLVELEKRGPEIIYALEHLRVSAYNEGIAVGAGHSPQS